jgi:hypothetical protein
MSGRKGKAKPGTWLTRELLLSPAYMKLSSTGKFVLGVIMLKRDITKQHECLNRRNINVTYKELESYGMSRGSITNALTDVQAKGFVEVVHQGGAFQQDKTVYGITDDWRFWEVGDKPIRTRQQGKKAGYYALEKYHGRESKKTPTTESGLIHTTVFEPQEQGLESNT